MSQILQPFEAAITKMAARGIKPGLLAITELLRQLGDPHKDLAVIHVAGTNGKGSVCAMLERCLRVAGYRTGLYTSPHMMRYNERFRVDGEVIGDGELMALLAEAGEAADRTQEAAGIKPTEFELLTAIGFLWFARRHVEVLILETGMGGRFDSTNVCAKPILTVITSISMDHEAYLGNTIALIAGEKAGIIKAGVSLVTSCSDPQALQVVEREFEGIQRGYGEGEAHPEDGFRPELLRARDLCRWETRSLGFAGQEVDITTPDRAYPSIFLPLPGQYQCENLACALLAWERMGRGPQQLLPHSRERLTEEALREGLASVAWPCRLELVQKKPDVVLDGSHNPDGIRQSAAWLLEERGKYDKVILVMGMVEDKDRLLAAGQLDGLVSRVVITKPLSDRAGRWQELARGFRQMPEGSVEFIEDCHEAVMKALGLAGEKDLVFCTGSFYLVGEMRKNWPGLPLFERII